MIVRSITGKSYEVALPASAKVADMKAALEEASGILAEHQILLWEGRKLDDERALGSYVVREGSAGAAEMLSPRSTGSISSSDSGGVAASPATPSSIFLFSKQFLAPSKSSTATAADASLLEPVLPPLPEPLPLSPVNRYNPTGARSSEATTSDVIAQFEYHARRAGSVLTAAAGVVRAIRTSMSEQYVQAQALSAAYTNLGVHASQVFSAHDTYSDYYARVSATHDRLLSGFEDNVSRVGTISLPPTLAAQFGASSLLDRVSLDSLRKWKTAWSGRRESFASKMTDQAKRASQLRDAIAAATNNSALDVSIDGLSELHADAEGIETEMEAIVQSFADDVTTVRGWAPRALLTHDTALDAQAMFKRHGSLLLMLHDGYDRLVARALEVRSHQEQTAANTAEALVALAQMQSELKAMGDALPVHTKALQAEKKAFRQFVVLERLPSAYYAGLVEAVRRNRFNSALRATLAGYIDAIWSALRLEARARVRFHKSRGKFLTDSVLPGLSSRSVRIDVPLRLSSHDAEKPAVPELDPELPALSLEELQDFLGDDLPYWLLDLASPELDRSNVSDVAASVSSLGSLSLGLSRSGVENPPVDAEAGAGLDLDPATLLDATSAPLASRTVAQPAANVPVDAAPVPDAALVAEMEAGRAGLESVLAAVPRLAASAPVVAALQSQVDALATRVAELGSIGEVAALAARVDVLRTEVEHAGAACAAEEAAESSSPSGVDAAALEAELEATKAASAAREAELESKAEQAAQAARVFHSQLNDLGQAMLAALGRMQQADEDAPLPNLSKVLTAMEACHARAVAELEAAQEQLSERAVLADFATGDLVVVVAGDDAERWQVVTRDGEARHVVASADVARLAPVAHGAPWLLARLLAVAPSDDGSGMVVRAAPLALDF
ncbi:hypothetical protein, variant [Thecamonas trahens ATCC 50062]|uniref:Ubiquitin-like domain-containing protein n=1 Tax=Thecamonas trahens ATCC 50062 TaxID=461836 RepID=A0A0L0DE33_THETB|nr:hypothetical protein, variant [Thecamonas trahens ATCC 50062]KNC49563.1 hypothetical protein, variant [Thecamonas trahens ATCC 50062]|eukprot:XP_013757673.1 hypothetical protein, variant [Thecamonas trahens ATCC 50062]